MILWEVSHRYFANPHTTIVGSLYVYAAVLNVFVSEGNDYIIASVEILVLSLYLLSEMFAVSCFRCSALYGLLQ